MIQDQSGVKMYDNLISRLDISLRNDWGVTVQERQRMRALIWESRDALKTISDQLKSISEVPVRANGSDRNNGQGTCEQDRDL